MQHKYKLNYNIDYFNIIRFDLKLIILLRL